MKLLEKTEYNLNSSVFKSFIDKYKDCKLIKQFLEDIPNYFFIIRIDDLQVLGGKSWLYNRVSLKDRIISSGSLSFRGTRKSFLDIICNLFGRYFGIKTIEIDLVEGNIILKGECYCRDFNNVSCNCEYKFTISYYKEKWTDDGFNYIGAYGVVMTENDFLTEK